MTMEEKMVMSEVGMHIFYDDAERNGQVGICDICGRINLNAPGYEGLQVCFDCVDWRGESSSRESYKGKRVGGE